jgi:hypothetical protein
MKNRLETELLRKILILAPEHGFRLFRNNIGAYRSEAGHYIKYGLCNPGGSDLIGWKPRLITAEDAGKTMAIFTAVEVKAPGGRVTVEQRQFLAVVEKSGGIASEVYSLGEADMLFRSK